MKKYEELLDIGLRLTSKRLELNLSQQEVADKAAITQQQLSNIENGANCTVMTMIRICRVLGITIKDLIGE